MAAAAAAAAVAAAAGSAAGGGWSGGSRSGGSGGGWHGGSGGCWKGGGRGGWAVLEQRLAWRLLEQRLARRILEQRLAWRFVEQRLARRVVWRRLARTGLGWGCGAWCGVGWGGLWWPGVGVVAWPGAWGWQTTFVDTSPTFVTNQTGVWIGDDSVPSFAPQPQAAPPANNFWYYCIDPAGYYPYVKTCNKPGCRSSRKPIRARPSSRVGQGRGKRSDGRALTGVAAAAASCLADA